MSSLSPFSREIADIHYDTYERMADVKFKYIYIYIYILYALRANSFLKSFNNNEKDLQVWHYRLIDLIVNITIILQAV